MAGLMLRMAEAEGKDGNVLNDLSTVEINPRSFHCAARRAKPRAGKSRAAPVEISADVTMC